MEKIMNDSSSRPVEVALPQNISSEAPSPDIME
jgi:hypothetical protein